MNAPSRLSTRTAKPPSVKPPGGFHYVCHSCGPVTGQPTNPDGSLILSYHWVLERKDGKPVTSEPLFTPPAPDIPAPAPRPRRGIQQADLFG